MVADATDVGSAWIIIPLIGLMAVALTIPLAMDRRAMAREATTAWRHSSDGAYASPGFHTSAVAHRRRA